MGNWGEGTLFWDSGTAARVTSFPSVREHLTMSGSISVVTTGNEEAANILWERLGIGGQQGIIWPQMALSPRLGSLAISGES